MPPLKDLLRPVLSNDYTVKDLRDLVHYSYSVVLPLIRKKIALGKLNLGMLGMREPDIVYDCLAELFQRDSRGRMYQLIHYFDQHQASPATTSDGEFLRLYRILLFSQIQKNIIRLYSEVDPALGKIIRNIKEHVARNGEFDFVERFGETYLVLPGEPLRHRTVVPPEELRKYFFSVARGNETIPQLLSSVKVMLAEQNSYQRILPLIPLCLLVKELYTAGVQARDFIDSSPEHSLDASAIAGILDEVVEELGRESFERYVKKNKRTERVVSQYLKAVRSILSDSVFEEKRDAASYYDLLFQLMPHLNKDEYASEHRSILEYLAKTGKRRLKERISRLYSAG